MARLRVLSRVKRFAKEMSFVPPLCQTRRLYCLFNFQAAVAVPVEKGQSAWRQKVEQPAPLEWEVGGTLGNRRH